MALTAQEMSDVRRYAGYPMLADQTASDTRDFASGWVLPGVYTTLFHLLNHLRTEEENTLRNTFLVNLYTQENSLRTASANMGTDIAAVWTRNKTEVQERTMLFKATCRDMCSFLGIPPGPALGSGGGRVIRS